MINMKILEQMLTEHDFDFKKDDNGFITIIDNTVAGEDIVIHSDCFEILIHKKDLLVEYGCFDWLPNRYEFIKYSETEKGGVIAFFNSAEEMVNDEFGKLNIYKEAQK